ncbi:PQQ-dependent sugar dehydrogenase [Candidatus Absconditicoccus praedator]|nr:PQQ-dependent sugar dehydrogenase [Candidatus Absconditicoccus praedator]
MTGVINVISEEDEYVQHQVDEVAHGFNQAWGIDFLPDGDILITEKGGNLVHVQIDGYETTNIANTPEVDSGGQGGLLDIAVHPNFPDQNWIYLTYSAANDEGTSTYLARAQLNLEDNELYDMEELFVADPHVDSQQHYGSRVNFDNDGYVYMTIGDRGDKTFDETHNSQDTQNHLGTTIRLSQDGSIPQDNPFVGDDDILDEIYSYGHRNSQGMTIHPETGDIWQSEHGEQDGDEINIIHEGGNYGWPLATYGCTYGMGTEIGTYPEDNPDTVNPIYYWECGSGGFPPAGMTFISTDTFPQWQGDLFLGNLAGTYLGHFEVDGENVSESEPLLADRGDRIRDVGENLTNGYIYVLVDDSDAPLLRITPSE